MNRTSVRSRRSVVATPPKETAATWSRKVPEKATRVPAGDDGEPAGFLAPAGETQEQAGGEDWEQGLQDLGHGHGNPGMIIEYYLLIY